MDVKARGNDGVLSWIYGERRPVILGWDVAGTVTEAAADVSDFKVGDEVFGMVNFLGAGNAYAEYVSSPANHLTLKPKNVSSAALPLIPPLRLPVIGFGHARRLMVQSATLKLQIRQAALQFSQRGELQHKQS